MKNTIVAICLLVSTSVFAQEWGDVDKNVVTMKEIAPIWPGCESLSYGQRSACFDDNLIKHIIKNYKYPAEAYNKNVQGRVTIEFVITEEGLAKVTKVTGGSKVLQDEAKRNIMSIPKMKPGMMGGKYRAIKHIVPITFKTGR